MIKAKNNTLKKNGTVFCIVAIAAFSTYALFMTLFLGWGFINSIKHAIDMMWNPLKLPTVDPKYPVFGWHFDNYITAYKVLFVEVQHGQGVVENIYATEMFWNSFSYSFINSAINLGSILCVSYCCARYRRKTFSKIIYASVVALMTIPVVGTMPARVSVFKTLGLFDNYLFFFSQLNFLSGYFLVFYAAFCSCPETYREAAELDGAGPWTVFLRIMLPLIKTTVLAVFILTFIAHWKDYGTTMVFWPSRPTVSLGLYKFQNSRESSATNPIKLCAAFIVGLPPTILFIIFRDQIMENVSMGGLKG